MSKPNELILAYRKLINKHYAAVQTDTLLEHTDNWKLEKKSKMFWDDFHGLEAEFIAQLEGFNDNQEAS